MQWTKRVRERIAKGDLPLAYNPYNDQDCPEISPTITTETGRYGSIANTLIMMEEEDG